MEREGSPRESAQTKVLNLEQALELVADLRGLAVDVKEELEKARATSKKPPVDVRCGAVPHVHCQSRKEGDRVGRRACSRVCFSDPGQGRPSALGEQEASSSLQQLEAPSNPPSDWVFEMSELETKLAVVKKERDDAIRTQSNNRPSTMSSVAGRVLIGSEPLHAIGTSSQWFERLVAVVPRGVGRSFGFRIEFSVADGGSKMSELMGVMVP